ncbi:unnamed protein product [Diplocarpon coronariae]
MTGDIWVIACSRRSNMDNILTSALKWIKAATNTISSPHSSICEFTGGRKIDSTAYLWESLPLN